MADEIIMSDMIDEDFPLKQKHDEKQSQNISNPSFTRVLDRIAFGSADEIKTATKHSVSTVPEVASNLVYGGASIVKGATNLVTNNIPLPDLLPDAKKIDDMVDSATIATYALTIFGITGSLYFTMKTFREIGQWRRWIQYRQFFIAKRNKAKTE